MRNLNIQGTKIINDIEDPKAQEESYATSISRAKKVIEFGPWPARNEAAKECVNVRSIPL